jgi:hypothetical protein
MGEVISTYAGLAGSWPYLSYHMTIYQLTVSARGKQKSILIIIIIIYNRPLLKFV